MLYSIECCKGIIKIVSLKGPGGGRGSTPLPLKKNRLLRQNVNNIQNARRGGGGGCRWVGPLGKELFFICGFPYWAGLLYK